MAFETAVVGNLALAEQWPRFSDTESNPTPNSGCTTVVSTTAADGATLVAHGSSMKTESYLVAQLENSQLDFFQKGDLQSAAMVIGENVPAVQGTADFGSAVFFGKENQQICVVYVNGTLVGSNFSPPHHGVVFGQWEDVSATNFGSLCLSDVSKDWTPGEKLGALRIQVRELYNEFLKWPGSYNQLLLSGSLDYCRSAIKKLRASSPEVQDSILPKIRSYYSQCYGISQQYREAKTTVRRLNLQFLQDKFELLQEACASAFVYPRLEDLDPADIPNE